MAYYKYQTEGKTANKFKEKADQTLEGELILAPNVKYNIQEVYELKGLGQIFNGNYRIKGLTRRIDTSGMTVSANVVFVGRGRKPPEEPKAEKAPTKVKADKYYIVKKGDNLWDIARRLTGKSLNWKKIEEANRKLLVARDKRNSNGKGHWIYPGQKLTIPGIIVK